MTDEKAPAPDDATPDTNATPAAEPATEQPNTGEPAPAGDANGGSAQPTA